MLMSTQRPASRQPGPPRHRSSRRTAAAPPVPRCASKPLLGGLWGLQGRYRLATAARVERGLHMLTHLVLDLHGGRVLAVADGKIEALQTARRAVHAVALAEHRAALQAAAEAGQGTLFPDDRPRRRARRPSRRRRQVFEASGGRCTYCRAALQLDGAWHVDHQLPRALDGSDDGVNLAAACARCNLAKSDRTALEFVAAPS